MRWLIAYDITQPRRLQRVYKALCGFALPLQESVFLLEGDESALQECVADVLHYLNTREDDMRIYLLPANGWWCSLGGNILPDGILLAGLTNL